MKKSINVLVDLFGQSIIELPVTYTISTDEARPAEAMVSCKITLADDDIPGWLYSRNFSFFFSQTNSAKASTLSVCRAAGKQNVYYEQMLNVVSDYIWLKEFYSEKQKSEVIY
ncbi:hypothetical protein D3C87_489350 [compost metagenome]|uniref:hypothetical protein n=1 Tax=Pedobacter ghigonis TaxID=2730403 RepID=UPI000FACF8A0|nr:hypothetical protein [Pedobacter ghigonis]